MRKGCFRGLLRVAQTPHFGSRCMVRHCLRGGYSKPYPYRQRALPQRHKTFAYRGAAERNENWRLRIVQLSVAQYHNPAQRHYRDRKLGICRMQRTHSTFAPCIDYHIRHIAICRVYGKTYRRLQHPERIILCQLAILWIEVFAGNLCRGDKNDRRLRPLQLLHYRADHNSKGCRGGG